MHTHSHPCDAMQCLSGVSVRCLLFQIRKYSSMEQIKLELERTETQAPTMPTHLNATYSCKLRDVFDVIGSVNLFARICSEFGQLWERFAHVWKTL